jgi:hypothetical protein
MNPNILNHRYYNWTIKSGDYLRDYESTEKYAKKIAMKKKISKLAKTVLYMGISISFIIMCEFYFIKF